MPLGILPFLPLIMSAIGVGAGAIENRKNVKYQREQNALDRQYGWDMYHTQRNDALSDWRMQNEYNSPMQMMKRLKEAGLSPHLFYERGGQSTSSVIRSAQAGTGNQPAPKANYGFVQQGMQNYMSMQQQQAATTNITAQTKLTETQMLLNEANRLKTLSEVDTSKYDLSMKKALRDIIIGQEREKLTGSILDNTQKTANIQFTLDQNERAAVASSDDHAKKLEEILTIRLGRAKTKQEMEQIMVMIDNLKKTGTLQDIEIKLREQGISPSDPAWMRIILMWLLNLE